MFLGRADIDDHIHFVYAVGDGVFGLKCLDHRRVRAEREADDRRDLDIGAGKALLGKGHVDGIEADGREMVLHRLVAETGDGLARRIGVQHGVVYVFRELGMGRLVASARLAADLPHNLLDDLLNHLIHIRFHFEHSYF